MRSQKRLWPLTLALLPFLTLAAQEKGKQGEQAPVTIYGSTNVTTGHTILESTQGNKEIQEELERVQKILDKEVECPFNSTKHRDEGKTLIRTYCVSKLDDYEGKPMRVGPTKLEIKDEKGKSSVVYVGKYSSKSGLAREQIILAPARDSKGRIIQAVEPLSRKIKFAYDKNGKPVKVVTQYDEGFSTEMIPAVEGIPVRNSLNYCFKVDLDSITCLEGTYMFKADASRPNPKVKEAESFVNCVKQDLQQVHCPEGTYDFKVDVNIPDGEEVIVTPAANPKSSSK